MHRDVRKGILKQTKNVHKTCWLLQRSVYFCTILTQANTSHAISVDGGPSLYLISVIDVAKKNMDIEIVYYEKKRERQRDRHRERERDRQTEREREWLRKRKQEREREREIEREAGWGGRNREKKRVSERSTNKPANTQTNKHVTDKK